jgi:hypothetical protein
MSNKNLKNEAEVENTPVEVMSAEVTAFGLSDTIQTTFDTVIIPAISANFRFGVDQMNYYRTAASMTKNLQDMRTSLHTKILDGTPDTGNKYDAGLDLLKGLRQWETNYHNSLFEAASRNCREINQYILSVESKNLAQYSVDNHWSITDFSFRDAWKFATGQDLYLLLQAMNETNFGSNSYAVTNWTLPASLTSSQKYPDGTVAAEGTNVSWTQTTSTATTGTGPVFGYSLKLVLPSNLDDKGSGNAVTSGQTLRLTVTGFDKPFDPASQTGNAPTTKVFNFTTIASGSDAPTILELGTWYGLSISTSRHNVAMAAGSGFNHAISWSDNAAVAALVVR